MMTSLTDAALVAEVLRQLVDIDFDAHLNFSLLSFTRHRIIDVASAPVKLM